MGSDAPPESVASVLAVEPATGDLPDFGSLLTDTDENTLAVQSVSSVAAARTILSDEHIDCVVCLHDPPSLDGVDVLSSLREDNPDLPVLLATETATTDDAVSSAATDVVQVSNGDIHPGIVTKRIQSIVSQARERDK